MSFHTTELFKCQNCGVIPLSEAVFNPKDPKGVTYFPYFEVLCLRCDTAGRVVCRGDTAACNVRDGECKFHGCAIVKG